MTEQSKDDIFREKNKAFCLGALSGAFIIAVIISCSHPYTIDLTKLSILSCEDSELYLKDGTPQGGFYAYLDDYELRVSGGYNTNSIKNCVQFMRLMKGEKK